MCIEKREHCLFCYVIRIDISGLSDRKTQWKDYYVWLTCRTSLSSRPLKAHLATALVCSSMAPLCYVKAEFL
jgi:hypothetical protein